MRALVAGDCGYTGTVQLPFLHAAGRHVGSGLFPALERAGRADELAGAHTENDSSCYDFTSSWFVRLRRIGKLLSAELVDHMLRWQTAARFLSPGTQITGETS